jgi:ATP-dependent DNA helicase RecQ
MLDSSNPGIAAAMRQLGYEDFKSDAQRQMIEAVTSKKDVLSIMPTGGGKTAGAVVPAIVHNWFVLVISPLKSLMADQCSKLNEQGIPAFSLTGDQTEAEKFDVRTSLRQLSSGPVFLFVSPEMAETLAFHKKWIAGISFDLLFVDEVHCVSVWGNSFRKKYQRIRSIWTKLKKPQIVAASATADPNIISDIMSRVPFRKKLYVEIHDSPVRDNLHLLIEHPPADLKLRKEKQEWSLERLVSIIMDDRMPTHGPTIIYCTRTRETEMLFSKLVGQAEQCGFTPALYHSKLDPDHKAASLRIFKNATKPLIIATSAFGMGIDRPDVRLVAHYGPPPDLVEYGQQIGRAGRDGANAYCFTLYFDWMVERSVKAEVKEIPELKLVEQAYVHIKRHWDECQDQQKTRFNLDSFNHLYAEWIRGRENIFDPERRIAMREESIDILRQLGYIKIDGPYVYGVSRMQFGNDAHDKLIELTGMYARRAKRNAAKIRTFFGSEVPTQELLFEQIVAE